MYSVIDIGSNTIRLVIYDISANPPKELLNKAIYASLISYVQNGDISDSGVSVLTNALNSLKKTSEDFGADTLYAFATASLRDVRDKDSLIDTIYRKTGIAMDILSGTEEALYDFNGLKSIYNITTGAAFDLGGGSCQLMFFENSSLTEYHSMPIGAQKMYNTFVHGTLPNEHERREISRCARKELSYYALLKGQGHIPVYAMGGAAATLSSMHKKLTGELKTSFTTEDLELVTQLNEDIISKLAPKRLQTIVPSVIVILEICKYIGTDKIETTSCGVRDGIIKKRI